MSFVWVVGSINVDLVVRTGRLPRSGETVTGGTFGRHGGGKGANQAVAAARDGARVRFCGAVGADELGTEAIELLASEGVDVSALKRIEDVHTGVALIVVDAAGENQIAVAPGANTRVEVDAPDELPSGGVLLANFEIADEPILEAAAQARDAGMRVVVNPAPARPLASELADLSPVLVPNAGEASELTDADDPEDAARRLADRTSAPVVVTLGEDGVLVADDRGVRRHAAPDVEAVDTTGAGDTFCGVLAASLARGADLDEAVERAAAAAALSVTKPGARGGMPRTGEIDDFR